MTELEGDLLPLRRIEVPGGGAEDVVVDGDGHAWTGTADGVIHRISPDGVVVRVASTGGRPLGLELLPDGRLLVCDATHGLLALNPGTGVVERLATEAAGRRILVCNNAAVARSGDIWFSDSSSRYPLGRWKRDFAEHTCTGRLLVRRADGTVEQHLDGLAFANGVALAADESFVLVAESGGRCVVRLWLTGERAGTSDLFVEDLPGYPDNIARGSDGLVWVTIASPTDPAIETLRLRAPLMVRKAAVRVPGPLQPRPRRTVRVQAYDDRGTLVRDVAADASAYHMATGVREHEGTLWIGSVEESAVAVVALPRN
jgi:sugar lactone lactonase YvrE